MVRSSVEKAFATRLSAFLTTTTRSKFGAFTCGMLSATVLQSATATIMLSASFISSGLLPLSAAIAVILGADMGSALAVRILFLDLSFLPSLLLLAGLGFYRFSNVWRKKQLGRIFIGLGLMLLSIQLLKQAVSPMMGTPVSQEWLVVLESALIFTVLVTALLTWLTHSSVAVVLICASMAQVGLFSDSLFIAMVLGANVGSGLIALPLVNRRHTETFSAVIANLAMRGAFVLVIYLFFIDDVLLHIDQFGANPGEQVINLHLAFNLVLGILFLPFNRLIAKFTSERLASFRGVDLNQGSQSPGSALDFSLVANPVLALSCARREAFRLADNTEALFQNALGMFETNDRTQIEKVIQKDREINARHKAIQSYLTETRRRLQIHADKPRKPQNAEVKEEAQSGKNEGYEKELDDILRFSTTMENIGDVVSHSLARLAIKRFDRGVDFSPIGFDELTALHTEVVGVLQLTIGRFTSRGSVKKKSITKQIDKVKELGQESMALHRQRLTQKKSNSINTSSIHQDTVRDLMQVVGLIDNMRKS